MTIQAAGKDSPRHNPEQIMVTDLVQEYVVCMTNTAISNGYQSFREMVSCDELHLYGKDTNMKDFIEKKTLERNKCRFVNWKPWSKILENNIKI